MILIQKWVRGHQARAASKKQKQVNFKEMRKLRRMLSVAYGKLRTKKIKQIIQVLKEFLRLPLRHCFTCEALRPRLHPYKQLLLRNVPILICVHLSESFCPLPQILLLNQDAGEEVVDLLRKDVFLLIVKDLLREFNLLIGGTSCAMRAHLVHPTDISSCGPLTRVPLQASYYDLL